VARTGLDVPVAGPTAQEAARRLTADGPNELPTDRPRNLLQEAGPRCASRVAIWCLAMHRQPAYLVPRGGARGGGLR
jgi:hypothetical protein